MTGRRDGNDLDEVRVGPDGWDDAVRDIAGPQIVVGGPGTGKTEFLVRRCVHLIDRGADPASLLVLGFSRRGVGDLRARIESSLTISSRPVHATTFHAFAAHLIELHGPAHGLASVPTPLTGPEQVSLVAELLATEDPDDWSPAHRGLLATRTFAREVTDFLLRCREARIDAARLADRARERDDWDRLPGFLVRYENELRVRGRIDYGTLLTTAVSLLDEPAVRDEVARQFSYVLVDEYQDTTPIQAALLDTVTRPDHHLVVAADPYQSIYSFRGADLANVAEFPRVFRGPDGAPARRIVLTTSFRVPRRILQAAERVAGPDLPGAAGQVTPAPGDGRVDVYRFEQHTEEAEWIASEIQRIHLADRIPLGRIGVFVRSRRRFLPELSRALERRRLAHDQPDARLADHPAVTMVLDCIIAACDPQPLERSRAVRRILLGPLFGVPLGALRDLERTAARSDLSWVDALREPPLRLDALGGLLADPSWATDIPAGRGFWHLWTALPQIREVVGDPGRSEERAAWASLSQVLSRLSERDPGATLDDYRRLAEDEEFEARPLLAYRSPQPDRVAVTTLHQSKGLEFDVVFVADAVEGVFPDLRTRESLLGTRHLSPHLPSDTAEYRVFRLQEERRLAYTAMVRASTRVVWTSTATGFDEGQGVPSRFLAMVAGTDTVEEAVARPAIDRDPVTALEAEAMLRRSIADPGEPPARRLAALALALDGQRWGMRPAEAWRGLLTRGSDTGIVTGPAVLSPSQAEAYEACPRRYVLERRLRIGDEENRYATLGSLVHDALETAERSAVGTGRPHGSAGDALGAFRESFRPEDFGGEPFAASWRSRGEEAIGNLYELWPSESATPIGVEVPIRHTAAGVEWVGRVDRLETRPGGLAVVDYKTSKTPMPLAEAARSIQLGFYTLAVSAGAAGGPGGAVTAAELWYPAKRLTSGIAIRSFDLDQLPTVERRMEDVADGIAAERWDPVVGPACETCRVKSVCPEWPDGREAFT